MSTLVAIAYHDVNEAEQVLETLGRLQNEYLIDLEDSVYVTKDTGGNVKLHQSVNVAGRAAGGGALWGGLWGLLLGTLVLQPIAGAAIGAGIGAGTGYVAGKLSDYGIDDNFVKQLGASLTPNSSAIIVLVSRATPDKVLPEISKYGGTVIQTSLNTEQEQRLRDALSQRTATLPSAQSSAGTTPPSAGA